MNQKISRRAFLRGSAVAAASLRAPDILGNTQKPMPEAETQRLKSPVDFRKQFIGQGLDERPMSYWCDINFFEKDESFYSSIAEDVTLAEFSLASTLGDFYWLRASKQGSRIFYQLYTEYNELTFRQPLLSSDLPLSLRELIVFLDNSDIDGDLYGGEGLIRACWRSALECQPDDTDAVLNSIKISSEQYQGLAPHYQQVQKNWIAQRRDA